MFISQYINAFVEKNGATVIILVTVFEILAVKHERLRWERIHRAQELDAARFEALIGQEQNHRIMLSVAYQRQLHSEIYQHAIQNIHNTAQQRTGATTHWAASRYLLVCNPDKSLRIARSLSTMY
jgi:hypothetical protein